MPKSLELMVPIADDTTGKILSTHGYRLHEVSIIGHIMVYFTSV